MKEEWRSAITTSGEQSVMISGPTLMPELSADNLDTQYLVNTHLILYVAFYERLFSVLVIVMVSSCCFSLYFQLKKGEVIIN